jgi:hypothetical protein
VWDFLGVTWRKDVCRSISPATHFGGDERVAIVTPEPSAATRHIFFVDRHSNLLDLAWISALGSNNVCVPTDLSISTVGLRGSSVVKVTALQGSFNGCSAFLSFFNCSIN